VSLMFKSFGNIRCGPASLAGSSAYGLDPEIRLRS